MPRPPLEPVECAARDACSCWPYQTCRLGCGLVKRMSYRLTASDRVKQPGGQLHWTGFRHSSHLLRDIESHVCVCIGRMWKQRSGRCDESRPKTSLGRRFRRSEGSTPDSNPLLWTDDLGLLFTQDLDPEPTKKIAALRHQLLLPASKTSSVPTPRPSLQAHPLRPLAFLCSVDPCDFHPAPKDCSSLISQKLRNADQPARQRLELLYHPRQLQRHEQSRGPQMFREA